MARIFITGSSDGLGLLAAQSLISKGHQVVLHARNENRATYALKNAPGAERVLTGNLVSADETKDLALKANASGKFDAIIHNAGVYNASPQEIFNVNVLAPYLLTCLIDKPKRLIYLSSDMHRGGSVKLESLKTAANRITYSDSKLHVLLLCKAIARKWKDVFANAVNPGWVPTKMGGKGAPDDLQKGYETQVWLATSNDDSAKVSGRYFFHLKERPCNPEANDIALQDQFITVCEEITGVR